MAHGHSRHDGGLEYDLKTLTRLANRRGVLRWLAGTALLPLVGCGGSSADGGSDAGVTTCSTIPEETAGPYPGDGSNGANALALSGIVRSDIRSSIAGATGVADGVPLSVELTLVNSSSSCAALTGYAIHLWHNLAQITLATDNVFSDGTSLQVPSITGSVANGYAANMVVAIAR
jgi:hypothetical protein